MRMNVAGPMRNTTIGVAFALLTAFVAPLNSRAQTALVVPASRIPPPMSRQAHEFYRNNQAAWNQFISRLQRRPTGSPQVSKARALPPTGGTWLAVTAAPAGVCNPLLLTDGTVIAGDCGTAGNWYKLTPDINGSYSNGVWSQIASLPAINGTQYAPLYFASAVLPDGRVIIIGGEYNAGAEASSSMGAIFDPVADAWTIVTAPAGWTVGNAPSVVLAEGTFLIAACCNNPAVDALFDATTLGWTATGAPNAGNGYQKGQGYELLPNGNVLTIDLWTNYPSGDATNAEQYVESSGSWISAGNTPVELGDPYQCGNYQIGPAALRADGTVVAFGGNTDCPAVAPVADPTAIFDSTNGTWSAGPGIPAICGSDGATSCTLADAPAALLPNGNVLFAASTGYVSSIETYSNSPTHFFEFTSANVVNQVADTIFYADSNPSYVYNFLVLPNGQILSTDSSNTPEVYTPTGGADPGWTPLISTAPSVVAAGATYPIGGTQFNGLSQGAYYGDGVQSWTNYPIVQITNSDTGHIFYARTFGHSTMSIEPGNPGSTNFTVPAAIETGASNLVVIANGIASPPVSVTVVTSTTPTYTLSQTALAFGTQLAGTSSTGQAVTVSNTGTVALLIKSITRTGKNAGQFAQTNDCLPSVAVGATCTINAVFAPNATGSKTAMLNVNAGGGAGTQTVIITGTGLAGPYTVSPTSLSFGSQPVGTSSVAQSVTVTNNGSVPLPGVTKWLGPNAAQYSKSNNCGAAIGVGASCTISVVFTPTGKGLKTAAVAVDAGGGAGTQTVALSGTGVPAT